MQANERTARVPRERTGRLGLGQWFGIEVELDASLILVFIITLFSLGGGTFAAWHPEWNPLLRWTVALLAALLFFTSILVHELSHAAAARSQGLKVQGITLFLFGGIARIEREPASPWGEFAMAIVGPLTSIAIGITATLLGAAMTNFSSEELYSEPALRFAQIGPVPTLLLWLGPVNFFLGLFNLIPGFPLDGGRVLRAVVWAATGSLLTATRWAATAGQIVGWSFVAAGLYMAMGGALPFFGRGAFQGLWFVLIGWFIASGARASLGMLLTKRALEGVRVRELMATRFESIPVDATVGRAMQDYVLRSDQHCFPVVDETNRFQGLLCWSDVRRVPREDWDGTPVADVMTQASATTVVRPDDGAATALESLSSRDVDQLPVVNWNGALAGIVRRRHLLNWLAMREGEGGGAGHHLGEPHHQM